MEIATLASSALGYLVTQFKNSKGTKKAIDETSVKFYDLVKGIFSKREEDLKDLEKLPEKESYQGSVLAHLVKHLEEDSEDIKKLENLIEELKSSNAEKANISNQVTNSNIAMYTGGNFTNKGKIIITQEGNTDSESVKKKSQKN